MGLKVTNAHKPGGPAWEVSSAHQSACRPAPFAALARQYPCLVLQACPLRNVSSVFGAVFFCWSSRRTLYRVPHYAIFCCLWACPLPLSYAVLLSLLQSSPAIADIIIMDASSSCALFSSSKVGIPCHRARECHEPQGFILVSLGPICISLCRATMFNYADELVRRT